MTPLALRYAWRELRGGLHGFGVFIACIALGVMAIAGVGSAAQTFADGLSRAGGTMLGGDLAFLLVQREANDSESGFLDGHGAVSVVAMLPTMAHTSDGRTTLVEIKAVDGAYPLFGAVATEPAVPLPALLARDGDVFGAAADPALLTRLDLKIGDRITIGKAVIELRAALNSEPDRIAGGISFGPRLLVSEAALRASALLQPGSLVRWQYRLRLAAADASDNALAAVERRPAPNSRTPAGTSAPARRSRRSSNAMSSVSANS
jgi:putative ABC transport system permease protein